MHIAHRLLSFTIAWAVALTALPTVTILTAEAPGRTARTTATMTGRATVGTRRAITATTMTGPATARMRQATVVMTVTGQGTAMWRASWDR